MDTGLSLKSIGEGQIFYRRRRRRVKRKSGNISWLLPSRWGMVLQYMVVLDADSVMTGDFVRAVAPDKTNRTPG